MTGAVQVAAAVCGSSAVATDAVVWVSIDVGKDVSVTTFLKAKIQ